MHGQRDRDFNHLKNMISDLERKCKNLEGDLDRSKQEYEDELDNQKRAIKNQQAEVESLKKQCADKNQEGMAVSDDIQKAKGKNDQAD